MTQQNLSNHTRLDPAFHYFGFLLLLSIITAASVNFFKCQDGNCLQATLLLCLAIYVALMAFLSRTYALKAQDRAIRAEEALRYFILTQKALPTSLKMSQIVALRFASDDEFVALTHKAIDNQLTSKDIKKEIKNWRGDYYRV
jgi:Family of unknown function (DUF6526)